MYLSIFLDVGTHGCISYDLPFHAKSSLPEPRILPFLQILEKAEAALLEEDITAPDEVNISRIIQSLSKRILGYLKAFKSPPANNFKRQFPQDIFRTSWSFCIFPNFQRGLFVFRDLAFKFN